MAYDGCSDFCGGCKGRDVNVMMRSSWLLNSPPQAIVVAEGTVWRRRRERDTQTGTLRWAAGKCLIERLRKVQCIQ